MLIRYHLTPEGLAEGLIFAAERHYLINEGDTVFETKALTEPVRDNLGRWSVDVPAPLGQGVLKVVFDKFGRTGQDFHRQLREAYKTW